MDSGELRKEWAKVIAQKTSVISLYDYLAAITLQAYGLDSKEGGEKAYEMVQKTKDAIPKVIAAPHTQAVYEILENDVFPVIEELLKIHNEGTEKDKQAFGDRVAALLQNGGLIGNNKDIDARMGHGEAPSIPQEWIRGDYAKLKESVESSIKELTRKLQSIKAEDLALRYETELKRGKLNTRALYRWPAGRLDIFKRKRLQVDRTATFAFSIWIDTSGSMVGDKMVHATRAVIMLAETMHRMDIPVEILSFENSTLVHKRYEDAYKGKVLERVGALAYAAGGGNRANMALSKATLAQRPERNKFVIALSDGEMDDMDTCKQELEKYQERGIHVIGIDISHRNAMDTLSMEKVFKVRDANELPPAFVQAFNDIVKKIKV
jgi:hypothetical protein